MMPLRTKLSLAAIIPAALSMASFFLSTTVRGHDAALLFRIGVTFVVVGFLVCLITWALHRVTELSAQLNTERAARRNAEQQLAELNIRVKKIEHELECRKIVKKMWTAEDDAKIQALFNSED